jgi:uracil-DNA glycosylase family 4
MAPRSQPRYETHAHDDPAPPPPRALGERFAPSSASSSEARVPPSANPRAQLGIVQAAGPALPAGPDADDRRMRLALVNELVRPCTRCALSESRTQTVFARGSPFADVCFVGEGPGADEDAQGEPFVGKAGQLLDRMIVAMGYRRDDVYICNVVKCRPPSNRKPEPAEMDACSPYLHDQLALVKPKVIVALGATAMIGLTGTTEGISRLRGKWKLYKGTVPIMPTFHPAYLLREPTRKREVWNDLQEVMKHLGKGAAASAGGESGGRDE